MILLKIEQQEDRKCTTHYEYTQIYHEQSHAGLLCLQIVFVVFGNSRVKEMQITAQSKHFTV